MTDFFTDVARIALAVADKHGFVLGGGVAWLVNGLVARPTEDVDLFTDTAGGVAAAADEVVNPAGWDDPECADVGRPPAPDFVPTRVERGTL